MSIQAFFFFQYTLKNISFLRYVPLMLRGHLGVSLEKDEIPVIISVVYKVQRLTMEAAPEKGDSEAPTISNGKWHKIRFRAQSPSF